MATATQPGGALGGRVVRALGWKAASQAVSQATSLVVLLVVAHALGPRQYGLAGMVLVLSTLVYIFADLALGSAIIQRARPTQVELSTVFWVSAGSGLACSAAVFGLAGPIAAFFGAPIAGLVRAFSATFLLTALRTVPYAILARRLDFRALEVRGMAAAVGGAGCGVALALMGAGAWAIIAQQLVVAAVGTGLLWAFARWRPSPRFSRAALRDLGGFGLRVFGTRVLFYLERNVDTMLVGRVLGAAAVGVYTLAYTLMLVPLDRIGGPMAEVLFPAFSRMADDRARLRAAWMRAVRALAAVVAPGMLLLIALAPDAVPVLLGRRWEAAVPVVAVLAWVGLHQSLQRFNSSVLQAVDRTGVLLRFSIWSAVVNIGAFAAGLHWGVVGVAVAYACSSTLVVAPAYAVLTARAVALPLREFARGVGGVLGAAAVSGLVAAGVRVGLEAGGMAPAARLALGATLGGGAYLAVCRVVAPGVVTEVRDLVRRRFG